MRANRCVVVFAGALFACGAAQLAAQSLADVAKKEEERRKQVTAASPGKVYTNKDLSAVPPSSTLPAPSDAGGAADATASKEPPKAADGKAADGTAADGKAADGKAADGKESGDKKDQAYWSGRMKGAREAIDRDQTLADAMQSRINALATDFVNRDDPAQRSVIERDRQRALTELDRLKKQIVADRKAVADLEEEARRAGVPPGWLR
jgi:hypothetical protein